MTTRTAAPALVVAGLSARALAEAAVRDGFAVWALDAFGDADTRAVSLGWSSIASATQPLRLDAGRLASETVAARDALCRRGHEVLGWVPGGGLEGLPWVEDGDGLPLLGTGAAAMRAVREAARFFETLDAWGIAHPVVRFEPPPDPAGWLWKDANGCGGTHIRAADAAGPDPGGSGYWQQAVPGTPVSATVLCNGHDAVLLGVNRQWVRPIGAARWTFGGLVGSMEVPGRVATALQGMASRLAHSFGLRGWCSLDAMLAPDGETLQVLELNPRWPASLAVYGPDGGLMAAHLQACLHGTLPDAGALARLRGPARAGFETVYARRALVLDDHARAALDARPGLHDRPWAPPGQALRVPAGTPLCTVQLQAPPGEPADALMNRLAEVRDSLLHTLETAS